MEHVGIDVHKKESQVCILSEDGGVLEKRIRTQRERFSELSAIDTPERFHNAHQVESYFGLVPSESKLAGILFAMMRDNKPFTPPAHQLEAQAA